MSLDLLYRKVADFEASLSKDVYSRLQCKKGCSRCCYTDLSVFKVEADHIREWFAKLPEDRQKRVRELWKKPMTQALNFHGETVSSCAFLVGESCTIYEARPLICRTQGMALQFTDESEKTDIDICPLNEDALKVMSPREVLSLDTLNTILSQLEKIHSGSAEVPRISLSRLREELTLKN